MKPGVITETTLLVVGFGNTLRQDDAAGPLVAERVAALGIPGVRALARPLLAPELAADLANTLSVVFVDATAADLHAVELTRIMPGDAVHVATHAVNPRALLAMTEALYGNAPAAWLLQVPAEKFGHGEELSSLTKLGIEAAVGEIRALVAEWNF